MQTQITTQDQTTEANGMQKTPQTMPSPCSVLIEQNDTLKAFKLAVYLRNGLTTVGAVVNESHQLSGINRANPDGLMEVLVLLITELADSLHTTERMNANQIIRTAHGIVKDFWYYKLEEIVLVLDNIIKQKNFNRLDQTVIYTAFHIHDIKRQGIIEHHRTQQLKAKTTQHELEIAAIKNAYERAQRDPSTLYVVQQQKAAQQMSQKEQDYQNFRNRRFIQQYQNQSQTNEEQAP